MNRKEYMSLPSQTNGEYDPAKGAADIRAYYGQFVTPAMMQMVASRIGLEWIMDSSDPHLNDIPLAQWDALPLSSLLDAKMREQGDWLSPAGSVIVHKVAARMLLEYKRGRSDYGNIRDLANWPECPPTEVSSDEYYEMLECVPPIYVPGGWLVGEATTGDKRGTVHAHYAERDGKFYARYSVASKPETFIRK